MPLTRDEYMAVGGYLTVDPFFEHMTLRSRQLGFKGLASVIIDLADDNILKHVDLSDNISRQEANIPDKMTKFIATLAKALKKNTTITALDLCSNHLCDFTAHPCNNHIIDYLIAITDALIPSPITHLDISDNLIVGPNGRMYTGLRHLVKHFLHPQGIVLKARKSNLHAYCFQIISEALGTGSVLEELDLSDNLGGIDPLGKPASDGISRLCVQLMNTLTIRVIRLARNHILDDDIAAIANAVSYIPSCQILDLRGNHCSYFGARALKYMIMCHGTLAEEKTGLLELHLSDNPLCREGTLELCEALPATFTLTHLSLACCEIDRETMYTLAGAMAGNSTIINLDVSGNRVTPFVEALAQSEADAMRNIIALKSKPLAMDATKLNKTLYSATAKKLRFLTSDVLAQLHHNPSFNIVPSEMRDRLHVLEPPGRKKMISTVKTESEALHPRLVHSKTVHDRMAASRKIYNVTLRWMREWQKERAFEKAMEALRLKQKVRDEDLSAET